MYILAAHGYCDDMRFNLPGPTSVQRSLLGPISVQLRNPGVHPLKATEEMPPVIHSDN